MTEEYYEKKTPLSCKNIFIFGFLKNEKSNITAKELQWLMSFAQQLLDLRDDELSMAIEAGELCEIKDLERNVWII